MTIEANDPDPPSLIQLLPCSPPTPFDRRWQRYFGSLRHGIVRGNKNPVKTGQQDILHGLANMIGRIVRNESESIEFRVKYAVSDCTSVVCRLQSATREAVLEDLSIQSATTAHCLFHS